ncbi:MAG: hypothetical protein RL199_954, partial [Pseudomonadota bacterium]
GTARAAWLARTEWTGKDEATPARYRGPGTAPETLAAVADGTRLNQLAWELARLVPGTEAGLERRMLHQLALAMLVLAQEGSTAVPLAGAGREALSSMLAVLDPEGSTRDAVLSMLEKGAVPPVLEPFIGARGTEPLLLADGALSLHRFARLEARLAQALAVQLGRPPLASVSPEAARAAFDDVLGTIRPKAGPEAAKKTGLDLTEDQQWALLNAVHLPFTVISGGPGTGKTTLVVSLLRVLVRLGVEPSRIALAAPTGKAANRMYEEVRRQLRKQPGTLRHDQALRDRLPEPRTLHRLLSYSPGRDRFGLGADNPVDADVVIVDESSMVDLFLMERLMRACAPREGAERRLVLLGDANQLPSVEAGMVLHELAGETAPLRRAWFDWTHPEGKRSTSTPVTGSMDPRARYLTTLTYSHRMNPEKEAGKAIYEYAEAIRKGEEARFRPGGTLALPARSSPAQLAFSHVEHLVLEPGRARPHEPFFERWWTKRWCREVAVEGEDVTVALKTLRARTWRFEQGRPVESERLALTALLTAVDAQRVLCLTRGRSEEGAERANEWFAARRRAEEPGGVSRDGFRAGEPVIFTVNDYGLRLFNGYSGVVVRVSHDGGPAKLQAVFDQPRGLEAFDLELLQGRLEHAYALTVHKAQGSQVECAALLLPSDDASPLLVRQLVYTAVSRASDSVVLVGDIDRLVRAVGQPVRRFGRLIERTKALLPDDGAAATGEAA